MNGNSHFNAGEKKIQTKQNKNQLKPMPICKIARKRDNQ
jgi:hypothetical protein